MKSYSSLTGILFVAAFISTGCQRGSTLFPRADVTALQAKQLAFYTNVETTLKNNEDAFKAGLNDDMEVDQSRRQKILMWQRDLTKADLLLQVPGKAQEKQELLLMKLAQLDMASTADYQKLNSIDEDRYNAIVALYEALITACDQLKANDSVISTYLRSSDATFVAKSFDVAGTVRLISTVRALTDQLNGVAAKTSDQQKAADQKLQSELDQAQQVIIKGLSKP